LSEPAAAPSILVVDDEPDSLETLRVLLLVEGFDVRVATSGPEALRLVDERLPDLLVADCTMPGMTGFELCGHVRARLETRGIPIVAYTSLQIPQHPNTDLYDWAVQKPHFEELLQVIRKLLSLRRDPART
jgi:putative two-component system response regulator